MIAGSKTIPGAWQTGRMAIALLILLSLVAVSCEQWSGGDGGDRGPKIYRKSTGIMDTIVIVTVVAGGEEQAEQAIDLAFDEIRSLEKLLSFWTNDSEIAEIYRNAGVEPVKVSPETLEMARISLEISEKTDGAFDPTIGPAIRLWDFRGETLPDENKMKTALLAVDYRAVEIDAVAGTIYLSQKGMSFDTGGIAKGYAADRAVDALREAGITSGLIAIAGDIRAFGERPGGGPWRVGIRNPRPVDDNDNIMAVIGLRDEAISTSGDYERYFDEDGVRYHHLLDPKTGQPARGLMSVSVIAGNAVTTDGYSTGAFVMGLERGREMIENERLEGIFVDEEGKRYITSGLEGRLDQARPGS